MTDGPPGPPLSQMERGALSGDLLASKNQKNLGRKGIRVSLWGAAGTGGTANIRIDGVVLRLSVVVVECSGRQVDVAGIGLHSRCGLADAGLDAVSVDSRGLKSKPLGVQ